MAARESVFIIGLLLCLAAVTLVRAVHFEGSPPGADQAALTAWAGQVVTADRPLPVPAEGQDWFQALQADQTSSLHHILVSLQEVPARLFDLVTLGWFVLVAAVVGNTAGDQVLGSVVLQGLVLLCLGLLPRLTRVRPTADAAAALNWVGALAVVLALASASLAAAVPAATVNIVLLTALLALWSMGRLFRRVVEDPERRVGLLSVLPVVLFQTLAIGAGLTSFAVLPLAFLAGLLLQPGLGGQRLRIFLWYAVLTLVVTALPAIGFAWWLWQDGLVGVVTVAAETVRDGVMRATAGDAAVLLEAVQAWAAPLVAMLSLPGFAVGLVGLLLLAGSFGELLPLLAVLMHLVVFAVIQVILPGATLPGPLFVLPLLLLGLAGFLVSAACIVRDGWPRVLPAGFGTVAVTVALAVFVWYGAAQWPGIATAP